MNFINSAVNENSSILTPKKKWGGGFGYRLPTPRMLPQLVSVIGGISIRQLRP